MNSPDVSAELRIVLAVRNGIQMIAQDLADFQREELAAGTDPAFIDRAVTWWERRLSQRIIERGEELMRELRGSPPMTE